MVLPVKKKYIDIFLNIEGHQNCCIGLKLTVTLLNGWILPTGGVALGRVCACSLRSGLVLVATAVLSTPQMRPWMTTPQSCVLAGGQEVQPELGQGLPVPGGGGV